MAKKLLKREVIKRLKTLGSGWGLVHDDSALAKTFIFQNYLDAFMFVTRLGIHAEVLQQYPIISLHKNTVHLCIAASTVTGLTVSDFELADRANQIVALSTLRAHERARRT